MRFGRGGLLRAALAELEVQVRAYARIRRVKLPLALRLLTHYDLADYGRLQPMRMGQHATEVIGEMLNVRIDERRLDVFLTESEEHAAQRALSTLRNPIALHVTSRSSASARWPIENWEALVRRNPDCTFFQLGMPDEETVAGCVDLRGKSLRESIALLKYSSSFIGLASSFSHATNAVGLPGVVLFGPSAPAVWAHANNINLTKALRCSPCVDTVLDAQCPYRAECLSEIGVDQVERALRQQLRVRERGGESAGAAAGLISSAPASRFPAV